MDQLNRVALGLRKIAHDKATNLTPMLCGATDSIFVLQRIDANGNAYPFTLQARSQTESFNNL